jgi:hypothetical protein
MAEPLALMLRRYEPVWDRGWPTNEAAGKVMLRRDRRAPYERIYLAAMPAAASCVLALVRQSMLTGCLGRAYRA